MTRYHIQVEIALLVSLLLHALAFGLYQQRETLARFPFWRPLFHAAARPPRLTALPHPRTSPPAATITFVQTREPEPPRAFMETDASQATGAEPKQARFYSDRATVAANPENPTGKSGDTPYLNGAETRVPSTESVPLPSRGGSPPAAPPVPPPPTATVAPAPAAPAPPAPIAAPTREAAAKGLTVAPEPKPLAVTQLREPAPAVPARAGPAAPPVPPNPPAPAVAARAAAAGDAAPAVSAAREIAALKSKLTVSGVDRHGVAAFNVAASPFGEYDRQLIRAVQSRWIALIEQHGIYERAGTVTIHFELYPDGSVPKVQRTENSAGEILALYCEKAILESAPFAAFPESLRVLVGDEPREVDFTFYY